MRYLALVLALVLSACSQKEESAPPVSEVAIESAAQLSLISGTPDFGQVSGSKTVIFQIRNTGDAASEIPTPALTGTSAASFSIVQSSGCAAALPKNGTCTVRVNFNSAGKSGGAYGANLKVGTSLTIPLSASVAFPPAAQYGIYDGATLLSSSLGLNFGNLSGSQTVQKILTLKNTGAVATPALSLDLTNNSFVISNSTCESKILQPGQSCSFKILFSTSGKSAQVYLSDLLFDGQVFPLSGTITAPLANDDPNSGVIIETFVNNEPLTAADLNLGILPNNQGVVKVLTFKNVGTATSTPMTAALSENGNFFIISNLCQDKILAPGASCSFRLVFSAISKNAGAYNVALTFPGVELPVTGEVLPTAECPTSTHLEDNTCVANTQSCVIANGAGQKVWQGSAYGACAPVSCNSGFDLVNNSCLSVCLSGEHRNPSSFACEANIVSCVASIPNSAVANQVWQGSAYSACTLTSCNANFDVVGNACLSSCAVAEHRNPSSQVCEANVINCTIANAASATQTWNGSAYGSCQVVACNSSFHNESNACVSDVRTCVIANGQGQETWNGSAYGACTVVACDNSYHQESNACLSDTRSCVIANGEGLETWMGSQYSACTAQSCNSSYHLSNNQCDLDVIDCTASITNAASATQTWNGSAYAACDLQSCVASYHEESNACASDVQDCTAEVPHAATATKTWNGSAYGSCQVSACASGYSLQGNACIASNRDLVVYNVEGGGSVSLSPTPVSSRAFAGGTAYTYNSGTQVTITPAANANYAFVGYGGDDCYAASGNCVFTINNDAFVRVYFEANPQDMIVMDINRKLKDGCFKNDASITYESQSDCLSQGGKMGKISSTHDANVGYMTPYSGNEPFSVSSSGIAYFAADDGYNGRELWRTDGTRAGTYLLKDINAGTMGSSPRGFAQLGTNTYFMASSASGGQELWKTDGTVGGTQFLAALSNVSPLYFSSVQIYPLASNKLVFFPLSYANNGMREVWVSDGTAAGTSKIYGDAASSNFEIMPSNGSSTLSFIANGNYMYFPAKDNSGITRWWVSDGTTAGTMVLRSDLTVYPYSFPIKHSINTTPGVILPACSATQGCELFVSKGTTADTYILADLNPGTGDAALPMGRPVGYNFAATPSRTYLTAGGPSTGMEFYTIQYNFSTGVAFLPASPRDANPGSVGSDINFFGYSQNASSTGGLTYMYMKGFNGTSTVNFYQVLGQETNASTAYFNTVSMPYVANNSCQSQLNGFPSSYRLVMTNQNFDLFNNLTDVPTNQQSGFKSYLTRVQSGKMVGAFGSSVVSCGTSSSPTMVDNGVKKIGTGELFLYPMWGVFGVDGTTTSTSASLIWRTGDSGGNVATGARVRYGTSAGNLNQSAELVAFNPAYPGAGYYVAALNGLNPSTAYYLQIETFDAEGRTVRSNIIVKATKAP